MNSFYNRFFFVVSLISMVGVGPIQERLYAQGYEPVPVFPASQILSADLLQGESYKVIDAATADGMLFSFSIWSRYGWFRPQSLDYLKIRLAEIRVMDALSRLAQEPLFLQGVQDQVRGTLHQTGRALTRPVETLKEVPLGLQKFGRRLKARSQQGRRSGGIGIHDKAKRELAISLGVDPYTDNSRLQEMLTSVATNKNRGQLVARVGSLFIPGGVGIAISAAQINKSLQEVLASHSPAELRQLNQRSLEQLGCSPQDVAMFLNHPGHTPTTQTAIRIAMQGLSGVEGINQYLSTVLEVPRIEVAHVYQRRIQMAASFHQGVRPLSKMVIAKSTPVFFDTQGTAVIFLNVDYLYWNETMERGLDQVMMAIGTQKGDIVLTGTASELAKKKLQEHGLTLYESQG